MNVLQSVGVVHAPNSGAGRVRIGVCQFDEAKGFLPHHYAAGVPARICVVLGAWMRTGLGEELVGVLTVSHPTLNGRWRDVAWPGEYSTKSKRENATRLNKEVRRISRVIVLPRHRGQGIATALVRAYLKEPLTKRTETIAAMGRSCDCFGRAGMRAILCGRSARDVKLGAALRAMKIKRECLVDDRFVARIARGRKGERFALELRRWANAARATRKLLKYADDLREIAPVAARGLCEDAGVWVFQ